MKGLFKFKTNKPSYQAITVLTNYQSCELGHALKTKLLEKGNLILVSPLSVDNKQDSGVHFQADLQNAQDINRLIAYLKGENMKIQNLIHN